MKKLKLFLFAAMIVGAASAFTTTTKMSLDTVYGYDGAWHAVDPSRIGIDFDCQSGASYCLYQDQSFDNPVPGQSENKIFVNLEGK